MNFTPLDLLVCSRCQFDLIYRVTGEGNIFTGTLICSNCQANYPVIDGIPHFIKTEPLSGFNRRFARMYDRISLFTSFSFWRDWMHFNAPRKALRTA